MKRIIQIPLTLAALALMSTTGFTSCVHVKVDPVEIKPIEVNVNVRVKVERELDNFFGDLDAKEKRISR